MNRMDKYNDETPELRRRIDKYSELYEKNNSSDYDKFDVDSNISVLKDNARSIDVDQIREMLDKNTEIIFLRENLLVLIQLIMRKKQLLKKMMKKNMI